MRHCCTAPVRVDEEKPLLTGFPATTALAVAAAATPALTLEPDGSTVVQRDDLGCERELLFVCHSRHPFLKGLLGKDTACVSY